MGIWRTRLAIGLTGAALVVAFVAVTGVVSAAQQPQAGGVLRLWMTEDPPTLDVQIDTRFSVYNRARDLFNTLLRYSKDGYRLEPELLASMPTVSADGLTYTFTLRSGVRFHDGTPLRSSDVKYTFERLLTPATKSPNTWILEPVVGAKEMLEGKAQQLAGLEIIDELRFRIRLSYPYAPFLSQLAMPPVSIYPEKAARAAGENWGLQPIGTGPFRFKEWRRGERLVFERNAGYFEKPYPYVDRLEFRIVPDEATGILEFEAGNFDITGIPDADFERLTRDPRWKPYIVSQSSLNTYYYMLNVKIPPLNDARVRKAIAMAIDREALVNQLLTGRARVANSFVSPGIPGQKDLEVYPYNPQEARRLLAEAGYPNGFSIETWQTSSETWLRRNEAIQAMLRQVGIDVKIVQVDSASYRQARGQGNIPIIQGNWWADFPDPDNYLYVFFHSTQSRNYSSNYADPQVDAWLERARTLTNFDERARLYQQAERKIVVDDVAVVPLWHLQDFAIVQPWVHDYFLHPSGVENALKYVWLSKR
ncbi:MAG: ABC transporter substrate-binding protein [Bacillota bacterium]